MASVLDRLSVLTDEVSGNLVEALDWAVRNGFKHVEIRMVDGANVSNLSDADVDRAKREIDRRGLKVSAIASPLFKCALDPARPVDSGDLFGNKEEDLPTHMKKLPRAIAIAKKLGTKSIRIFSFWREKDPKKYMAEIVEHLKKAAAVAEKEGVLLLQENENACNGGYAEEVAEIVRRVGSPAMRVLWDPGNENYGGRSCWPEGYEKVKGLFAHVHLKDSVPGKDGKSACVPIGQGKTPLREQIAALEKDGYAGLYTLETRYTPPGGTPMQGTEQTLAGLKKILS
ncbi:MAG: sugar phosphate isomerase/epimerase [Planctomycetes bacterium]|nr:sugar phosphate isomerase/epimerase [Planctomycetota bacterium]